MFGSVPAVRFAIGQDAVGAWQRAMAFLRGLTRQRKTSRAVATPRPLRPVIVPASLGELRGPASGVVELPVRLYWSGSREFDLADPHQAADLYEAVLDTASTVADLTAYLDADVLVRVWPVLGMSRAKREAWEGRFPVLRHQRLAAVA